MNEKRIGTRTFGYSGGRVHVLLDGQWGSSGKGKMAPWLCDRLGIDTASTSNMPNAGHTTKRGDKTTMYKVLPSSITGDVCRTAILTGASVFDQNRLEAEVCEMQVGTRVLVHDRAVVMTAEHARRERESYGLRALASTMQGSSAAMIDKISRGGDELLARHLECPGVEVWRAPMLRLWLDAHLAAGGAVLHEVSQGFALSIDHGSHYPQCTSRNCTTARGLDDLGVSPRLLGEVFMNLRPYPIRVGNIVGADGDIVGHSGGGYADCHEVTWQQVGEGAGMPQDEIDRLTHAELTTVTKRLRRVFTFSWQGLEDAVRVNGVTCLLLNFAQYLDWELRGARGETTRAALPRRVRDFVYTLEETSGKPVIALGTGADYDDILIVN